MSGHPPEAGSPARVLITRAPDQAGELGRLVALAGWQPVFLPVLAITPASSDEAHALRCALAAAEPDHWLVLTSANGVAAVTTIAGTAAARLRAACVGLGTAAAASRAGLRVSLVPEPEHADAEGLLAALLAQGRGSAVLAQAANARDLIATGLQAAGWTVSSCVAYHSRAVAADATLLAQLDARPPRIVTIASSATVSRLIAACGHERLQRWRRSGAAVVAIGRQSQAACEAQDLGPEAVALEASDAGLVAAIAGLLSAT